MKSTPPIQARERWRKLSGQPFDVLIIGAGIHGATLACRAAQAGLQVALIDKGDYGEGASANSLKILHGGLRYLQQLNIRRMRESIVARREGLASLPYLTRPAQFIAPARGCLKRSLTAYRLAAHLNNLISFDANQGLGPDRQLSKSQVLAGRALQERLPGVDVQASGALLWGDGFIENTERYTLAYVMSAQAAGAVTANYVRAKSLLREGNRILGVRAAAEAGGSLMEVRAAMTINATGGWWPELEHDDLPPDRQPATPRVRAYNLVVDRQWFGSYGVGLDNGTRNFFFAPWRGGTLIGTHYDPFDGSAEDCRLTPDDIASFVDDVNQLYPQAKLSPSEVTFAHVGVLPGKVGRAGRTSAEPSGETRVFDASSLGVDGYWVIQGIKYTTADAWAKRLVARLPNIQQLSPRPPAPPLYGAEQWVRPEDAQHAARARHWDLDEKTAAWLVHNYGARYAECLEMAAENQAWRANIPGHPIPRAAIAHAVRHEDARHVNDVVFRRTDIGTFARPSDHTILEIARLMAGLLQWGPEEEAEEVRTVAGYFKRIGLG